MLDFNTRSEITHFTLEEHIAQAADSLRGFASRHSIKVLDNQINSMSKNIAGYFDVDSDEIYHEIARRYTSAIFGLEGMEI